MLIYATKGLNIRKISSDNFVIEDVLGNTSLPFASTLEDLPDKALNIANTQPLFERGNCFFDTLNKLDHPYIAHIEYSLLDAFFTQADKNEYYKTQCLFPLAYHDTELSDLTTLKSAHNAFQIACREENFAVSEPHLHTFLIQQQSRRLCSDILALLHRSTTAYQEIIAQQRYCILSSLPALKQLGVNEIVHQGDESYRISTALTILVISLCTSMDLSAKLVHYLNSIEFDTPKFKQSQGKQYKDLKYFKAKTLSQQTLDDIHQAFSENPLLIEVIQFRHDLIHTTTALETERIYVGYESTEIKDLPLHYSAQYIRDCQPNGQPHRFLGRNYFTDDKVDLELKSHQWIDAAMTFHLTVGNLILNNLKQISQE